MALRDQLTLHYKHPRQGKPETKNVNKITHFRLIVMFSRQPVKGVTEIFCD